MICASYSGELAAKLAQTGRSVVQHPGLRTVVSCNRIAGKNTEAELETSQGGFRYTTSVGGTLTGRGGSLIVIDDPMKPDEAMSTSARERIWDWFSGTVGSRLDNKAEDAIISSCKGCMSMIFPVACSNSGGWEHLSIPAIAENEQELTISKRSNPDPTCRRRS